MNTQLTKYYPGEVQLFPVASQWTIWQNLIMSMLLLPLAYPLRMFKMLDPGRSMATSMATPKSNLKLMLVFLELDDIISPQHMQEAPILLSLVYPRLRRRICLTLLLLFLSYHRGGDGNVSLSAFAYLYSELVQYHQGRVTSISELERRLESAGYGVGLKISKDGDIVPAQRIRYAKRETRLMSILHFVSSSVWKALFGKAADSLERSIDHADEFMIVDYEPITSTFVSVPSDFGQLSVDAYISGIIAGVLDGAGFTARVTAHSVTMEEGEKPVSTSSSAASTPLPRKEKAVFLVKFAQEVLARDAALER
eukprot:scaffold7454_cov53-Attheya_sp.AAC.4